MVQSKKIFKKNPNVSKMKGMKNIRAEINELETKFKKRKSMKLRGGSL